MRHIGLVLADVMRSIESQRATNGPHEFTLDTPGRREAEPSIERAPYVGGAMPAAREGTGSGNGKGKGRGTKAPPSSARGGNVHQAWETPGEGLHASPLTMSRSKVIASPNDRNPRLSAIIFDLGMERARRHASLRLRSRVATQ